MDKKIAEKLKDKSFVKKLIEFETFDEVKSLFKSEGLEISDDEIKEMGTALNKMVSKIQEVPADELENVSGGGGFAWKMDDRGNVEGLSTHMGRITGEGIEDIGKGVIAAGKHVQAHADIYGTGVAIAATALITYGVYMEIKMRKKQFEALKAWWKGGKK